MNKSVENELRLYSRLVILLSSILSPIFGAIFFSINLFKVGKKKQIVVIIVSVLIYQILINKIKAEFNIPYLPLLLIFFFNFIVGILISKYSWNYFLGNITYEKRSALIPILIYIGIAALLIILNLMNSNIL